MWTYEEVRAADAELGIPDPAQAVVLLNAQAVKVVVDIPTPLARKVLMFSGDWKKIKSLANRALSGTEIDAAICAADSLIDTFLNTETLHTADPSEWAAMQPMMQGLHAAGVLSIDSLNRWNSMREVERPKWDPPISEQDLISIRNVP